MSGKLPNEWIAWLFENKLLGVTTRDLISVMQGHGFSEEDVREEVRRMMVHPYFEAAKKQSKSLNKITSQLDVKSGLLRLGKDYGAVDRVERLSREDFLNGYYSKNRPVVMTGIMKGWAALSLWTPKHFEMCFGDVEVEIMADRDSNANYEIEIHKHRRKIRFGDYVSQVFGEQGNNDRYLVANNDLFSNPWFRPLLEDVEMFPEFLDPSLTQSRVFFWMGPRGTITPLHHDMNNILLAQVIGRKRVKLISPDQTHRLYNHIGVFSQVDLSRPDDSRFPLFRDVIVHELVLEPGEVLFIPVGWWHFVESLDPAVSVSFTNFSFPNQFEIRNPKGSLEQSREELPSLGDIVKSDGGELYLDLLKKALSNYLYLGADQSTVGYYWMKYYADFEWKIPPLCRPHTCLVIPQLDNLERCLRDVVRRGVPGDFLEAGVYKGGAVIFMRGFLKAMGINDRIVWVADSFSGIPLSRRPAPVPDTVEDWKDRWVASLEEVQSNFARYGLLDDQVRFLPGLFADSLPNAPVAKLAIARLDGDSYESTMDALKSLYPKISPGGYLIIDDWHLPACRQAVFDFRAEHGIQEPLQVNSVIHPETNAPWELDAYWKVGESTE